MEIKKHPKADMNRWRSIFMTFGLIVAMGIVLAAFEWSTPITQTEDLGKVEDVEVEEEIIPVTRQEPPKPKKAPPKPKVTEVLNIVEDDVEIEEEMDIVDMEATEEMVIEIEPEEEEEEEEEEIFFVVEEMPSFPGGTKALSRYIAETVKYPAIARENDIQGKVFVRFCVTKTGKVSKVSVARGVDPLLDKEAMRVVKNMPNWKPGSQRGQAVNVWYTVPINFQLQ